MTKFRYPSEGLYNPNRNSLDNSKTKINAAITSSGFSVPSSFAYRNYCNNLKSLLNSMKEELDVIERLFKKNDNDYKVMSDDIHDYDKSMSLYEITERERMII